MNKGLNEENVKAANALWKVTLFVEYTKIMNTLIYILEDKDLLIALEKVYNQKKGIKDGEWGAYLLDGLLDDCDTYRIDFFLYNMIEDAERGTYITYRKMILFLGKAIYEFLRITDSKEIYKEMKKRVEGYVKAA